MKSVIFSRFSFRSAALDEWESTNGWLDEADVPESDSAANLALMPDVACALYSPIQLRQISCRHLQRCRFWFSMLLATAVPCAHPANGDAESVLLLHSATNRPAVMLTATSPHISGLRGKFTTPCEP